MLYARRTEGSFSFFAALSSGTKKRNRVYPAFLRGARPPLAWGFERGVRELILRDQ